MQVNRIFLVFQVSYGYKPVQIYFWWNNFWALNVDYDRYIQISLCSMPVRSRSSVNLRIYSLNILWSKNSEKYSHKIDCFIFHLYIDCIFNEFFRPRARGPTHPQELNRSTKTTFVMQLFFRQISKQCTINWRADH